MPRFSLVPDHYTRANYNPKGCPGLGPPPAAGCLIELTESGVELDLNGSVLDGEGVLNTGIYVHDCESVTIRNGVIKGFYYGIRAVNLRRLAVRNCVVTDNHNPANTGWLNDTHKPVEEGFGGGIHLLGASGSIIADNLVNNNFNAISLVRSTGNRVSANNASYSSNAGIYLLASTHNSIEGNQADHCIRYTGRFWCDTADSAGILLEEYSNHNRVLNNSMRYSGDGFFIRANNRHASNHNYVVGNDASYSPNNAFEAVFSAHNVFENNAANYSNYGFWLGYSRNTTVRGNLVRSNRFDGIAIEAGQDNRIEANRIESNRNGIRLWKGGPSGGKPRTAWTDCVVSGNEVAKSRECGVLLGAGLDVLVENNLYRGNRRDAVRQPPGQAL